jgi:hypothetical protein
MTYPLRDVPEALWRKVKQTAARNGHSIRYVLIRLLEEYISTGEYVSSGDSLTPVVRAKREKRR